MRDPTCGLRRGTVAFAGDDQTWRRAIMADNERDLTPEELEAQEAAELPDREAMSLINANLAAPINAAVAANVLSDNSIAYANAEQTGDITQTI
jgi:hypothetical protein